MSAAMAASSAALAATQARVSFLPARAAVGACQLSRGLLPQAALRAPRTGRLRMSRRRRNLLAFVPKRLGHACKDKCAVAEFMNKSGPTASWAIVNSYKNNSILTANDWRVLHFMLESVLRI